MKYVTFLACLVGIIWNVTLVTTWLTAQESYFPMLKGSAVGTHIALTVLFAAVALWVLEDDDSTL